MNNLNTHSPASFYETLTSEETRRLVERFEFHYPLSMEFGLTWLRLN